MHYKGEKRFFDPRMPFKIEISLKKKKDREIYKIDKCCVTNSILDLHVEKTRTVQRRLV